jgi:hypothetical protein
MHELTIVEKIWTIIIEVIAIVAEFTSADSDDLITQVIENNKRLVVCKV